MKNSESIHTQRSATDGDDHLAYDWVTGEFAWTMTKTNEKGPGQKECGYQDIGLLGLLPSTHSWLHRWVVTKSVIDIIFRGTLKDILSNNSGQSIRLFKILYKNRILWLCLFQRDSNSSMRAKSSKFPKGEPKSHTYQYFKMLTDLLKSIRCSYFLMLLMC